MIVINDNAYIKADQYCLMLYVVRDVKGKKTGTITKKPMIKGYFPNINMLLDSYIEYLNHQSAEEKKINKLEDIIAMNKELKNTLANQFELKTWKNFDRDYSNKGRKRHTPSKTTV